MHAIVPLDQSRTWDEVWPQVKEIGAALVRRDELEDGTVTSARQWTVRDALERPSDPWSS